MLKAACVYWIRHKDHDDMFSQGYVGITKQGLRTRMYQHNHSMRDGSTYPLYNAMRKYGKDIVVSEIVFASLEYCQEIENKLRPSVNIGWNICAGGADTRVGSICSMETRTKISAGNTGKVRSAEFKSLISKAVKGRKYSPEFAEQCRQRAIVQGGFSKESIQKAAATNRGILPWNRNNSDTNVWLIADQIYDEVLKQPTIGIRTLGKCFGLSFSKFQVVLKKIKGGWIPTNDQSWLNFKTEKEIQK